MMALYIPNLFNAIKLPNYNEADKMPTIKQVDSDCDVKFQLSVVIEKVLVV